MTKNTGFTLIEVLIAMLVLAVGLLGLAGLQAVSLGKNQSAYNRGQATQLAYDIADRMRANSSLPGNYLTTFMAPTAATCATTPCMACRSSTNSCTPAQLATQDLFDWNLALSTLPSGTGTITISGAVYTITVNWDDNRDGSVDAADPNFQTSFHL
jgi:type IV pilus assembly protein PilV